MYNYVDEVEKWQMFYLEFCVAWSKTYGVVYKNWEIIKSLVGIFSTILM